MGLWLQVFRVPTLPKSCVPAFECTLRFSRLVIFYPSPYPSLLLLPAQVPVLGQLLQLQSTQDKFFLQGQTEEQIKLLLTDTSSPNQGQNGFRENQLKISKT